MPTTQVLYYVGRLNLMPTRPDFDEKRELIERALNASVTLSVRGFDWGFLNISPLIIQERNFFAGYLVKFKPETRLEIAQMETRTLQTAIARGLVDAKARFFLEVETGLIYYHPALPEIQRDSFEGRFCRLFEKGLGNFFITAEIDAIREQYSITEELQLLDIVLKVDVTLRPSNPDHSELWADQDAKLKRQNAKWSRTQLQGTEDNGGLRVKDDLEILAKLHMAEDGYGYAAINGRQGKKKRRITSRDAQISNSGPNDEMEDGFTLSSLLDAFDEMLKRLL